MILKFVCDKKLGIFVAFHFYFLLDLFKTALSLRILRFFLFQFFKEIPHHNSAAYGNVQRMFGTQLWNFKKCIV